MPTFREKLKRVNWSPFFIKVTIFYVFLALVPQFLFAIPYWLENEPWNLDLNWQLLGDHDLPSALLTIFYFFFGITFVLYLIVMFDYKFNREYQTISCVCNKVDVESIEIPVGGGNFLVGDLFKSRFTPKKDAPTLILHHGLGSTRQRNYQYGIALSLMGLAVVFYDARGHGETKEKYDFGEKWDGYYIIRDLKYAIDWVQKRAEEVGDLNKNRIIVLGFSLGGAVALNEGYLDERVDFVIGCCTFGDYQHTTTRPLRSLTELIIKAGYEIQGINLTPSNLQSRLVSPILNSFNRKYGYFRHPVYEDIDNNARVCLAHARDDEFVNFENFQGNIEYLKLDPANYLVFEKGNHKFAKGETALLGKMLFWLATRGY